jgi:hypothetical protein
MERNEKLANVTEERLMWAEEAYGDGAAGSKGTMLREEAEMNSPFKNDEKGAA